MYGESKGDIWELFYYTKEKASVSDNEAQNFIDLQTREMSRTFDPPPGLNPDQYADLFLQHFMKSRKDSKDILDKNSVVRKRHMGMFQVGNVECLLDIRSIQESPDFDSWENPGLVEYFTNLSRSLIE